MANVTNPANFCFRSILSRICSYTAKMKPSFTFITFNAIFFELISIFITIVMTDITQVYKFSRFFWLLFYFLELIYVSIFFLRNSNFYGVASDILWCTLFFVIKNQITFFLRKWCQFYYPCCTINMVQVRYAKTKLNLLRYYSNIFHQKVFFLNDSHQKCKQKTKNVYNWQ